MRDKFLPSYWDSDPNMKEHFEKEAKRLAVLSEKDLSEWSAEELLRELEQGIRMIHYDPHGMRYPARDHQDIAEEIQRRLGHESRS